MTPFIFVPTLTFSIKKMVLLTYLKKVQNVMGAKME
jgi:hypothetical protein